MTVHVMMPESARSMLRVCYYARAAREHERRATEALAGERPADDGPRAHQARAERD